MTYIFNIMRISNITKNINNILLSKVGRTYLEK